MTSVYKNYMESKLDFFSSYLVGRTQFDLTGLDSVEWAAHAQKTSSTVSKEIITNKTQFMEANNHFRQNLNGLIR
jgi:hypothetical protein